MGGGEERAGEPYLFECVVVARDKNDGESLKSMWHSTTTDSTPSTPSSTLGGIAETQRRERRHSRARV